MDPLPELEALRAQLQQRHVEHVQAELSLAATCFDMSRVESEIGEREASMRSLMHSKQGIAGAYAGIERIDDPAQRAGLEAQVKNLEAGILQHSPLPPLP